VVVPAGNRMWERSYRKRRGGTRGEQRVCARKFLEGYRRGETARGGPSDRKGEVLHSQPQNPEEGTPGGIASVRGGGRAGKKGYNGSPQGERIPFNSVIRTGVAQCGA